MDHRFRKKVCHYLVRLPGLFPPVCFAVSLRKLLLGGNYRHPTIDFSCWNGECTWLLLGIAFIFAVGVLISVCILRGNTAHSVAASFLLAAMFLPFAVFGRFLPQKLYENLVFSHTGDISDYGEWDEEIYRHTAFSLLPDPALTTNGTLSYTLDRKQNQHLKTGSLCLEIRLDDVRFSEEMNRIRQLEIKGPCFSRITDENEIRYVFDDMVVYDVFATVEYSVEHGWIRYTLNYGDDLEPGVMVSAVREETLRCFLSFFAFHIANYVVQ